MRFKSVPLARRAMADIRTRTLGQRAARVERAPDPLRSAWIAKTAWHDANDQQRLRRRFQLLALLHVMARRIARLRVTMR